MNRFYLILLVLSLTVVSCNKSRKSVWMYYDETSCADKWTHVNNNEKLKNNVIDYLGTKNIKIYEMEIFVVGNAESCSACTCKTGRRYKIKVQRNDVSKAENEGLYQ
jgi:hypothetical protein